MSDAFWPKHVQARFDSIPVNPRENDYYAPYNKLLYSLFPADTPFTVAPQSYPLPESRESLDFLIEYQILLDNVPVFILEIKSITKFAFVSSREEADQQIRKRLRDLVDVCPLLQLHAVSAFGTKLCFYVASSGQRRMTVTPARINADAELLVDTAPRARWDCDILEEQGAIRFRDVIEQIKKGCADLGKLSSARMSLSLRIT